MAFASDNAGSDDLAHIASALPEVNEIRSERTRRQVLQVWAEIWRESSWRTLQDVPKNPCSVGDRPLLPHVRSVARQALATAEIIKEFHGISYDRDVLVAASLLHDVSKLVEYEMTDAGASPSRRGELIQHGIYGAHVAWVKGMSDEIVHSIIAHTRKSNTLPSTWEAIVVHYVDYLDSDALLWEAGGELLLR